MANVNQLLNARLKKNDKSSKMAVMAQQSANGQLTSFSGMFSIQELSDAEKFFLENLLREHAEEQSNVSLDLRDLTTLTSEVKAINHQAALLHGERIKKAHKILIRYREGAFTAWLIAAYGNRQTPYNFWQYYEFWEILPKQLRVQVESMPRQAIYTLASRQGPMEKKREIIESYQGQTKHELLRKIRDTFPLATKDKRRENHGDNAIQMAQRLYEQIMRSKKVFTREQRACLKALLNKIIALI